MGIYAEGLKELLAGNDFQSYVSTRSGQYHSSAIVFSIRFGMWPFFLFQLKNWVNFPNDKVIMSSYSRAFGQEWFYADFTKEYIENLIKVRLKNTKSTRFASKPIDWTGSSVVFFHAAYKARCPLSSDSAFRVSACLRGKTALCGLRLRICREKCRGTAQSHF